MRHNIVDNDYSKRAVTNYLYGILLVEQLSSAICLCHRAAFSLSYQLKSLAVVLG